VGSGKGPTGKREGDEMKREEGSGLAARGVLMGMNMRQLMCVRRLIPCTKVARQWLSRGCVTIRELALGRCKSKKQT
jgi:hypothetical protein